MTKLNKKIMWIVVFSLAMIMGVPWFLWGSHLCFVGIPLWVIYHAGWLIFLIFLFWLFVRNYWVKGEKENG